MSVFLCVPAKTRCVNKRVLTCINVYKRIFTYIHASSFKKNVTKKQSTMLAKTRVVGWGISPSNRRPDPCLYTFMQCINVYKKYRPGCGQVNIFYVDKKFMQIYVDIKIYRPGWDVYVKFMFLHKCVYYMYTCLCEFWQAPTMSFMIDGILDVHTSKLVRNSCRKLTRKLCLDRA